MSAKKSRFFKKGDWIILAAVAAIGLLLLFCNSFLYTAPQNGKAVITVDGKLYGEFSLYEDRECIIQDPDGGSNTVTISDGTVRVKHADCPDRLCIQQGAISRNGQSVVCLPHGLVITVKDGGKAEVDM